MLEFISAYEMARRDLAVSDLRKVRALQIIRLATGHIWQMLSNIKMPTLPIFTNTSINVEEHPEILMRQEALKRYEELLDVKKRFDREGMFTIGGTVGKDFPGGEGSGVRASVNILEPLKTAFSKDDKANLAKKLDSNE